MPQTKTFTRLGQHRWRATVLGGDGENAWAHTFRTRELRSRPEAKRWIREWMQRCAAASTLAVHGDIREGRYVDCSFDDPGFGFVHHAEFDDEDTSRAYCFLDEDGAVQIEWED